MSRIGRRPIIVPDKVNVSFDDGRVTVNGPLGDLVRTLPVGVTLEMSDGDVRVRAPIQSTRRNKGFLGLGRALVANMVEGVTSGFTKRLEINGVGYRADVQGNVITMAVGYSHPVVLELPEGVECQVDKSQTKLTIKGIDKQQVGNIAARLRAYKVSEPYKGKGIKYAGEEIRRKVGKAGGKK
ncbi:MAG: 50S ribosomal protein L6 [Myxococcota bacterium]|nr:50S ribosomal protein L6 [Myxococcota bacterium]